MARLLLFAPVVRYFKCHRSPKAPCEYIGDWPRRRRCYTGTVKPCPQTGRARVFLQGVQANAPHGGFSPWCLRPLAEVWLN